ncbi:tetratricopeptide repeat protein, partial [Thermodesulfobacteriota bacterium]
MDFLFFKKRLSGPWFALILIGLSVLIFYSNIYNSPFVFDDEQRIVENKNIKNLSSYLSPSKLLKPRAVVDLTFALNYRFGKLNVFGYHLVNVLIHMINGFLVYFLIFVILKQLPEFSTLSNASTSKSSDFSIGTISLFAALIFVVHPIQTQAVTYTVQRYASMSAMFY